MYTKIRYLLVNKHYICGLKQYPLMNSVDTKPFSTEGVGHTLEDPWNLEKYLFIEDPFFEVMKNHSFPIKSAFIGHIS